MTQIIRCAIVALSLAWCASCTPVNAVTVDDILEVWSEKGQGGIISVVDAPGQDPGGGPRQAYRMRLLTSMPGPRYRSEVNSRLQDIPGTPYTIEFRLRLSSHDPTSQGILLTQWTPPCWVNVRLREKDGDYVVTVSDVAEGSEANCTSSNRLPETVLDSGTFGPIVFDEWAEFRLQGIADGANSWVRFKQKIHGAWVVMYSWNGSLNRQTAAQWHFGMYTGTNEPAEDYEAHFQILFYSGMASF